jgi:hypothetical protein
MLARMVGGMIPQHGAGSGVAAMSANPLVAAASLTLPDARTPGEGGDP